MAIPVALTMYTVRDDAARDYLGTVRNVAEMGYAGIQSHFQACDPAQLKSLAGELGVTIVGIHAPYQALDQSPLEVAEWCHSLGCPHATCASIPEDLRDPDGYERAAEALQKAGGVLKEESVTLSYHNHDFEFRPLNGTCGYDILFNSTSPDLVQAEIDVYWVEYAGVSALEYIRKFSGRLPLLHIKDMGRGEDRATVEIGEGRLDWPPIMAAAEQAGVQWAIVEQDVCRRPPLESARLSLENLKKIGLA